MTASDFERPVHFYGMHISLGQALWYELFDDIHHPGADFCVHPLDSGKAAVDLWPHGR